MFERFRRGARQVVELALEHARLLGHNYIGTEHLLLGLLAEGQGVAARVLISLGIDEETLRGDVVEVIGVGGPDPDALGTIGIDLDEVRRRVEEAFGPGALESIRASRGRGRPGFTPRSKKVLELSLREARVLGHRYLDTEHVLLGLIREGEGVGVEILKRRGILPRQVRTAVYRQIRRELAS